jgi:hypothetical protein
MMDDGDRDASSLTYYAASRVYGNDNDAGAAPWRIRPDIRLPFNLYAFDDDEFVVRSSVRRRPDETTKQTVIRASERASDVGSGSRRQPPPPPKSTPQTADA